MEAMIKDIRTSHGDWNARSARRVLSMICQHMVRMCTLDRNFVADTTPVLQGRTEREALEVKDIQAVRRALQDWESTPRRGNKPNLNIRLIMDIILGTSMRPGEVLAGRPRVVLEVGDEMYISVNGTIQPNGKRKPYPKRERQMRKGTAYLLNNLNRSLRGFRVWCEQNNQLTDRFYVKHLPKVNPATATLLESVFGVDGSLPPLFDDALDVKSKLG